VAWVKRTPHDIYSGDYRRKRKAILARDGYQCQCDDCKKSGRVRLATEVDHKIGIAKALKLGWTREQINADSNLSSINADCHERKNLADRGVSARPRIGLDGYPVSDDK
jgi:5-methylcytosine-specific restriction protein A